MMREHLLLDPAIRDWVVIPMIIIVVLVNIGRQSVHMLIKSNPQITESDLDQIRHKQVISQSTRLRMNGRYLNSKAF